MAKLLKLRRGTTTQHGSFTGAEGEVTIDTTKDTAVVHDGSTQAGRPLAREDMNNVSSATIAGRLGTDSIATTMIAAGALPTDVTVTNANVVSSAAIAGTKISPNFGSQAITTTGALNGAAITGSGILSVASTFPQIKLEDIDTHQHFSIFNANGTFRINDDTNSASRLEIAQNGTVDIFGNLDVGAGLDVTGDITISDGEKLSLHTYADIETKTGATNAVVSGLTGHVLQNSLVFNADNDIWLASSGKKITFGTSDSSTHEVMRVQCAAVGASQHGYVNLNYVTANAGQSASSATKLATTATGIDVTGNVATTGDIVINSAGPKISLVDTGQNPDYDILNTDGVFQVNDTTNSAVRWRINTDGQVDVTGTLTADEIALANDKAITFDGKGNIEYKSSQFQITNSTGDILIDNNAAGGDVQVYTDTDFEVYVDNGDIAIKAVKNGSVELYEAGSKKLETSSTGVSVTGALVASGDVTAFSDATLKTEINTINDALGTVGKLRGVSYKWLKDGKPSIGVIAQEVEEVIPEVVHTTEYEGKNVKSVDYGKLVGVLIEAVKELKTQLDEHKAGGK